jgi:GT2 family glycosyltransferase
MDAKGPGPEPASEADRLQQEIERSRAEIFALRRLVNERELQIDDMLSSTSWRITAPLRNLGDRFKQQRWLARFSLAASRRGPSFAIDPSEYERWTRLYSTVDDGAHARLSAHVDRLPARPLISVIMPSYNIDPKWVSEAISSVRRQIYPRWELCISDDASTTPGLRELLEREAATDTRIRVTFRPVNGHISANSNSAFDLASGDYIALMDADDLLPPDALFWVAHEIALHPETDLIFSDEDKIDDAGHRFDPYFKPAWNPALMLSQNAFCHLGVFRRSLVEQVGRFREGYEGAQDHDLALRCADATTADRIRHIPRVLYHWRASAQSTAAGLDSKPYAWQAGHRAIEDSLKRRGINGRVEPALGSFYQVIYAAPDPLPHVSIIMPTTMLNKVTPRCLQSVLTKTRYANFELLLVASDRDHEAARARGRFASFLKDRRVRAVEHKSAPFNFSWVNNRGAVEARGDLLCFLNDDVEVISEDWLDQLVARIGVDGVGAVGPMLFYPSGLVQQAGVLLGVGGVADHAFRNMRPGQTGYFGRAALEQDYSCLTAACLLVRRELFEAVNGFDVTLPTAFNDVDLCIRMRHVGARLVWTPAAQMYHHESTTFGPHNSPGRAGQFSRDVEIMRERWHDALDNDPSYNPNLSLDPKHQFQLAAPPRTIFASSTFELGTHDASISRTSALNGAA